MSRGELWTVSAGVYDSKPRPVLILQNDLFAATASVPLTSTIMDAPLLRIAVAPDETTGLERESYAMVDKITTVRRTNVGSKVGALTPERLLEVERAVMVFLGLAR